MYTLAVITLIALSLSLSLSLSQYCEYCRLNSGCFLDANETKQCQDTCGSDYNQILRSQSNLLHRDYLLNEFGQILYSQFIGTIPKFNFTDYPCREYYLNNFLLSRSTFLMCIIATCILFRRRGVSSCNTVALRPCTLQPQQLDYIRRSPSAPLHHPAKCLTTKFCQRRKHMSSDISVERYIIITTCILARYVQWEGGEGPVLKGTLLC